MVFDRPDYCFDSEHLTGMPSIIQYIDFILIFTNLYIYMRGLDAKRIISI